MTCFHAKPAWFNNPATQKENPQRISMSPPGRYREPDMFVQCNRCEGCRTNQRRDWGVRIFHETQMHKRNAFITLTYDQEHLPDDNKITKDHFREFIHRLHHSSQRKLRYFGCGEYGDKNGRPHYHAIIFGEDFRDGSFDIDDRMYGNAILDRIWGYGQTSIADPEAGACMYTAGYVTKKTGCDDTFAL